MIKCCFSDSNAAFKKIVKIKLSRCLSKHILAGILIAEY
jgi:hypothetical protein